MQLAVVIADSFEWVRYDSLWICRHNHTTIAMTSKFPLIPFIRRNSITKWRINYIFALPLSFSSCLSMFLWPCITILPKLLSVDGWYPATPGQSRSRQNFTDSSSDSGQNGRLRLTPTPATTPTPQPCWWVLIFYWRVGACLCIEINFDKWKKSE